jgi:hypothetical protein
MTTQLTSPWPMLTWRAPSASSRATSAGVPEAGDPGRVGGVNAQALDAYRHVPIVSR